MARIRFPLSWRISAYARRFMTGKTLNTENVVTDSEFKSCDSVTTLSRCSQPLTLCWLVDTPTNRVSHLSIFCRCKISRWTYLCLLCECQVPETRRSSEASFRQSISWLSENMHFAICIFLIRTSCSSSRSCF